MGLISTYKFLIVPTIERYSPLIFAIAGGLFINESLSLDEIKLFIKNSESSVLTVSITLGGFLLTIYTILNSIDNKLTKALKEADSFHLLGKYLNRAVKSNFFLVLGVFGILIYKSMSTKILSLGFDLKLLGVVYLSVMILATLQTIRIIYYITRLLSYPSD